MRLDHLLSKELTHFSVATLGPFVSVVVAHGWNITRTALTGVFGSGWGCLPAGRTGCVRWVGDGHAVGSWENRPPHLWVGVFLWMAVLLPASTVRVGVWGGVCWLFENRIVDASIWTSHTCRGCVWGVLCDFVVVFLVLSDSDAPGHAACQCVGVCECSRAHGGCLGIRSR